MATAQLSEMRDRLELILSIPTGDSYVDSTSELDDIKEAYQATADLYNFPQLLVRYGIVLVADLDRYSLPATLRKIRTVRLKGVKLTETELEFLKYSSNRYVIDGQQADIIVMPIPTAASVAFTITNSESAGSAVTIELNTVSGLSKYDEIFVKAASLTDEFSIVSAVGTLQITARLDSAKSASDIIYRVDEILDILGYRKVPVLSGSTDTILLPDAFDFIICHYAAYLAYLRLEQFDRAKAQKEVWKERCLEAWSAYRQNSTGLISEFIT